MTEEKIPTLGGALSGRYNIEREIGRGASATVWLAEDIRHSRQVAIKLLKPELAAMLAAAGAEVKVVEINPHRVEMLKRTGLDAVGPTQIYGPGRSIPGPYFVLPRV